MIGMSSTWLATRGMDIRGSIERCFELGFDLVRRNPRPGDRDPRDEDRHLLLEAILSELDRNLPVDISAIWLMEDDDLYLAACHNCDECRP